MPADQADNYNKTGKRNEPRQALRIQRKKMPNGLIKIELRYVSYQSSEATPTEVDIASAALSALNHDLNRSLRNAKA